MKTPIKLKTPKQIALLRTAGEALTQWLASVSSLLEQSILRTGQEVEEYFSNYLKSFQSSDWTFPFPDQVNTNGDKFSSKLCVSVNDAVAHCRPTPDRFVLGDIITVDAGLAYRGWCSDSAVTVIFGSKTPECKTHDIYEKQYLISGVHVALEKAILECKPGNKIGQISTALALTALNFQLGNITGFMGHGIGQKLHEPPLIPADPSIGQSTNITLRPGMIFCLEPMFTLGSPDIILDADGWTIFTADSSLAAHCEIEVLITRDGHELLTTLPRVF